MRDIFLVAIILVGLLATLRYPFAGILLWTWFTVMDPHQGAFGFVTTAPLNLIIAVVTILSWLFSKEPKLRSFDLTHVLVFAFLVWITFNGFFAVDPSWSWPIWNITWKTILLGLLISKFVTNKVRAHALIWTVVVSLLYYGIKGGIFTLVTGGGSHVLGPTYSQIGDNNTLALATLMVLPLVNYLRLQSASRWVSLGLLAGMALSTVSIVGSYSRGAFIALGGLSAVAWFRARNKFIYPIAAAIIVIPIFLFMPQNYFDRLDTIKTASSDPSFHGRVVAWKVAWSYATEHFPFGDGMAGGQLPAVFNHYFPSEETHAAHSIYFQVLGDNGFIGLILYVAILVTAFSYCSRIRKATRGIDELHWAYELTGMIQLSLFVFCLGGAALSMAYYDVLFINVGLLSALRTMLATSSRANPKFSATKAISGFASVQGHSYAPE
jgi:putative inorganic carbon (HCO3(-)) transporter